MDQEKPFDILDYLNTIYMKSAAPQIDVLHAGGNFNRFGDDEKKDAIDEEILEINKKRINIPNAEIKQFSYQQQGDVEEYNEPEAPRSKRVKRTRKNGKSDNKASVEGEQERGFGGSVTDKEIVEI